MKRILQVAALVALSSIALAAVSCGGGSSPGGADDGGSLSGRIVIDGSSTVGPIAEAAAEEFGNETGVKPVVGISGTGGGFEKFCRGETDITNASRPVRATETQHCADNAVAMTEFQIATDALTVAVHPDNDWAECLTFTQLRAIFDLHGTAERWSDLDPSFPDEPISIYSPGADSGTFDYFSEEVNGELDRFRNSAGVTFSEDDNVLVLGISNDPYAIGYFGYAYFTQASERVKAVKLDRDIDRGGGSIATTERRGCIEPSEATVLDRVYPLSRPLFMYVSNASLKRSEVRAFMRYVLEHPDLITEVGYIRLEEGLYRQGLAKLDASR